MKTTFVGAVLGVMSLTGCSGVVRQESPSSAAASSREILLSEHRPVDAIQGIVAAFKRLPVVIMAEWQHGIRKMADFYVRLMRDSAFQETAQDIVIEFASRNDQPLLDRHIDGENIRMAGSQTTKPKLKVEADGLPSGHDSPEGVACDVVRSLINRNARLFSNSCVRLYAGGTGPTAYAQFLRETAQNIRREAAKKAPSPGGPKSIGKVFAARHLSKSGPVAYGYAAFGFQDIMFVDVSVFLYSGERSMMRTLLIKDKDGKWYVHPAPSSTPLLSEGLDEEKASVVEFSAAYDLAR